MNIAVIPARGGSKRIPKKNIKLFNGKPIIQYSIELAIQSNLFERIIVSTDDIEIAAIARDCGAEVPHLRDPKYSEDHSTIHDAIRSCLVDLNYSNKDFPMYVCCILATAPLLDIKLLKLGLEKIIENKHLFVFGASEFSSPIERGFYKNDKDKIQMLFPNKFQTRSQDLKKVFFDAGQFTWATLSTWLGPSVPFNEDYYPIEIPSWRVQDIDTINDWTRAELIFKALID